MIVFSYGKSIGINEAEETNKNILAIEQQGACYKGCQFTTQPIFGLVKMNSSIDRIMMYDECVFLCKLYYNPFYKYEIHEYGTFTEYLSSLRSTITVEVVDYEEWCSENYCL